MNKIKGLSSREAIAISARPCSIKYLTVGSRFTTGLGSRIFGCKLNRLKTSNI